jgi:putative OPT family oligopeptide transporter
MEPKKGLSRAAFEPIPEGSEYEPFIPADKVVAELTFKAALAGILFGILFGAANAYLGLRAGLTISTSIPVAVLTVAGFKILGAMGSRSSILEANFAQTVGSASSSVASGVIFTLPALFLWQLDPTLLQMTLLAMCGGLIGILFMVPLRRFLIQGEHGRLPYPEGTACAEVLVASEIGGSKAHNVFRGLAAGAGFKLLTSWLKVIPSDVHFKVPLLRKGELGMELSPALFGVGYILGPRIGGIMVGGGLLSWLVIIPVIGWWFGGRAEPLYPETVRTIAEMTPSQIWTRYVRYIGAGAVAAGGLITLIRSIPTMIESFRVGARQIRVRLGSGEADDLPRTGRDLPLPAIGAGIALIWLLMATLPQIFGILGPVPYRALAAMLVIVAAFFFVTVSSRIVGLVGVTSNPTSGMTIATLLMTSAVFLALGWTGDSGKVAALTVGCVVAIAASIAGDTSQDLKTGFLLGATPARQQAGELVGVITSAAFVCIAVLLLDRAFGFGTEELPAPQATLMKLVIEGVLDRSLPWALVGVGVGIAVVAELLRIPSLAFAVGVYLPVSTMVPVFLGGLVRWLAERRAGDEDEASERRERGVLFGSGLVGGEGLLGVAIAAAVAFYYRDHTPEGLGYAWAGAWAPMLGIVAFGLLALYFWRLCTVRDD